jgi:hypothetical protein
MVTLAGLEPATSPVPPENKDALSPLSYSVVMIFMTVCGGAAAGDRTSPSTTVARRRPNAASPCYFSILTMRVVVAPQSLQV